MTKNISFLNHDNCCGCRSCADVCLRGAISYAMDQEGFFFPKIDESLCVQCGLCEKICPEFHVIKNAKVDTCYAAYAIDHETRNSGSSGGVFGIIAKYVIERGGHVYGAAFNEKLKVQHQVATSEETLKPLYKSKYIQSDCSGIYNQVKKDIANGYLTLFCGTPCQCNALKNLIGKNSELLILVDIVCHGVPSQKLFDQSIDWWERHHGAKVKSFDFRYKKNNISSPKEYIIKYVKNGNGFLQSGSYYQFPYYLGFQKYLILRPSCYSCQWASPDRCGDVTLGDFWGIDKFEPKLDARKGVSLIIPNTDKGHRLVVNTLLDNINVYHLEVPFDFAVANNGCLCYPTSMPIDRSTFFDDLQNMPFDAVVKKYLKLDLKSKMLLDIYYALPNVIKKILRVVLEKRMK